MSNYFLLVPIVLAVVFVVSVFARRMEWFINVCIRFCIGTLALFIAANVMLKLGCASQIGINPTTVLTVGVLGIPGFCLVVLADVYFLYG